MKTLPVVCFLSLCHISSPAVAQTSDVGSGAPSDAIARGFVSAYFRNTFYTQLSLPPIGDVKKFGTAGLVQEFPDAAKTAGVKFALIKPDISVQTGDGSDIFQLSGLLYSYYSSVGVTTAGQPASDTLLCPDSPCQYQRFDKNYVLFAYLQSGGNYALRDPFHTKWTALGGINALGAASSAEQAAISAVSSAAATVQTYKRGALYNITSGTLIGRLVSVSQPVYDLYATNGGHTGFLGYPTSDPINITGGGFRQTFEGGSIDYSDSTAPALRLPVKSVAVTSGNTTVRLNLNDTLNVRAATFGANGDEFTDRGIAFVTSNGRVISVQQTGAAAVLRAVGGGTATVTAVSEGKISPPITLFVTAPCCQIGEGAPTAAIQQIFQDAVTRTKIIVRVPAASPVHRAGAGLVQELQGVEPNAAARFLVTVADRVATGYVVSGPILSKYDALGGPAQVLGYTRSDAVYDIARIGRQLFEGGAIAGNPARVVSGGILQKWATLNYEAGPAGQPVGDVDSFLTFSGAAGRAQPFQNGAIYEAGSNKVYLVAGLIAAKYDELGAGTGQLGLPTTDEFASSGKRHQDFEGGSLEYAPNSTDVQLTPRARKPSVTTVPSVIPAGGRLRVTIAGFPAASSLRVSLTGQTDFVVRTQTGSYFWDLYVPANAATGTVTIRAVDVANAATSISGTYSIRSSAEVRAVIGKLRGDAQSAAPGSLVPQSLRVVVRDDSGNPLAGTEVKFSASPGAQVSPSTAVTNLQGQAETFLRMPLNEGIVLANAEAARQVVTFSARSVQSTLTNYPKLPQSGDSMLTATASILRFYQNRGDLSAPNGLSDPVLLGQFLKTLCSFDAKGERICDGFVSPKDSPQQFVNLWRLAAFASNNVDVSVERPEVAVIRDLLAQEAPVLLSLAMTSNGQPAGAHFVVAIGVSADGSILIYDPNPAFGQNSLSSYLGGFTAGGVAWKGALTSAVRLLPGSPSPTGFVVATAGKLAIISQTGECGLTVEWPDAIAPGSPGGSFRQRYCDGVQPVYQIDVNGSATVTDLSNLGSRQVLEGEAQSIRASRPESQLILGPQGINFSSQSVVNAATYTADIAVGGLIAIFGDGLTKVGETAKVEIGGRTASISLSLPYQVNVQIPLIVLPGTQTLRITSAFGVSEQTIEVKAVAPAMFRLSPVSVGLDQLSANKGAILNQDLKLNLPSNPARRGTTVTVFGTGFGPVKAGAAPNSTVENVTATIGGSPAPVSYSGLTPGFAGLYQVNVLIPASAPPGLDIPISFRISGVESSPVEIAIQ